MSSIGQKIRRCIDPSASVQAFGGRAASFNAGRPGLEQVFNVGLWVPLKPPPRVSCFWRLLFSEGWPRRTPFSRAENPPIAFICKLKKQVRRGLVLRGEGQSAISDRAGVAHGVSTIGGLEDGSPVCLGVRRPAKL